MTAGLPSTTIMTHGSAEKLQFSKIFQEKLQLIKNAESGREERLTVVKVYSVEIEVRLRLRGNTLGGGFGVFIPAQLNRGCNSR